MNNQLIKKRSLVAGLIAFLSLLLFYFALLTLANSFSHALEQFLEMWYWLLFLAIGFGVQFSLYWLIRDSIKTQGLKAAKSGVAASGSISTASMIACCAHHLVDLAPLVGLSALWIFLADYQLSFVLIGLFANLIGIGVMLNTVKKHNLAVNFPFLQSIMKFNFSKIILALIIISIITTAFSFYSSSQKSNQDQLDSQKISKSASLDLEKIVKEEGGLTIEADPLDFKPGNRLTILVNLSTHQGDLDFDLTEQTYLIDDLGKKYLPTSWDGSSSGHHLSGNLMFPMINLNVKQIKLIIKDIYNLPERSFAWSIE